MKPFLYIVADDPTDPVVGAEPMARASMHVLGEKIHTACANSGLSPFTFRPFCGSGPYDEMFEFESETILASSRHGDANPLFSMLVDTLSSRRDVPFGETVGVWFDDVTGFAVPTFVEAWRRVYPFRELPPLFGMIHTSNRRGYATQSILRYQGHALAGLSEFKTVFAPSEALAENVKEWCRARVVAPYFADQPGSATSVTWKDLSISTRAVFLNWMYSFSHVDGYARFVLMIDQLNDVLDDRRTSAAQDKRALPDDEPPVFSGRIFAEEFPKEAKRPDGFDIKDPPAATHIPFGLLQRQLMLPDPNSITVSFDTRAESDYRLISLAERGYMVFAPNTGIYRENIHPLFLYEPHMLDEFDPGMPRAATIQVAERFFTELLKVRAVWRQRGGAKNLRQISRVRAHTGSTNVVDTMLSAMGLNYDEDTVAAKSPNKDDECADE